MKGLLSKLAEASNCSRAGIRMKAKVLMEELTERDAVRIMTTEFEINEELLRWMEVLA